MSVRGCFTSLEIYVQYIHTSTYLNIYAHSLLGREYYWWSVPTILIGLLLLHTHYSYCTGLLLSRESTLHCTVDSTLSLVEYKYSEYQVRFIWACSKHNRARTDQVKYYWSMRARRPVLHKLRTFTVDLCFTVWLQISYCAYSFILWPKNRAYPWFGLPTINIQKRIWPPGSLNSSFLVIASKFHLF